MNSLRKSGWNYLIDLLLAISLLMEVFVGVLLGFVIPEGPTTYPGAKYWLGLHRHQWGTIHLYVSLIFVALLIIHLALHWRWITARTCVLTKRGWTKPLLLITGGAFVLYLSPLIIMRSEISNYDQYEIQEGRRQGAANNKKTYPGFNQTDLNRSGMISIKKPDSQSVFSTNRNTSDYQGEKPECDRVAEEAYQVRRGSELNYSQFSGNNSTQRDIQITGRTNLAAIQEFIGISPREILRRLELPPHIPETERLGYICRYCNVTMHEIRQRILSCMKNLD